MIDKKLKDVVDEDNLVLVTLAEDVEFFDDKGPTVVHAGLKVFVDPVQNYMIWGGQLVTVLPWQYRLALVC